MGNERGPVIRPDRVDTLFQPRPKSPPGATDLRQMSSLMDGSASGCATKLQQNFLAWLEAGLVVPVTARGRDVLARVNIPSSPAICSNGGCILDDEGSLDLVWHMQLEVASRHSEIGRASCRERVCQYV